MIRQFTSTRSIPATAGANNKSPAGSGHSGDQIIAPSGFRRHRILRTNCQESVHKGLTYAGWGMRIAFVPDDRVAEEPEVEVREPRDGER